MQPQISQKVQKIASGNSGKSSLGMSSLQHVNHDSTYEDLRNVYISSYGVEIQTPSFNFIDAKIVPNQSEQFIVTLSNHILPKRSKHIVQTTFID